MSDQIRITYKRSAIGRSYMQKRTVRALGFTKLNQARVVDDTPSIRGMMNKVIHLLNVEPIIGCDMSVPVPEKEPEPVTTEESKQEPTDSEAENNE